VIVLCDPKMIAALLSNGYYLSLEGRRTADLIKTVPDDTSVMPYKK